MERTNYYRTSRRPRLIAWLMLLIFSAFATPLWAQTPNMPTDSVIYDAESGSYIKLTKMGDMVIDRQYMTFEEYQDYQMTQLMKQYWDERSAQNDTASDDGLLSKIPGFSEISKKVDGLLTIPDISINPTGSADLTFQIVNNYRDDKNLDVNKRSVTNFDFDENIQVSLNAKIGDLFDFDINWNTMATFDFENKLKLKYEGKEDDILQLFEAGDISFPLTTTLIHGSQELFGFHTKLKFGKLTVDAVVSEKKTSTENMQIQGGASTQEFQIRADEYEENRHYFLSQYFYDNYNKAMATLPTPNTNIRIIRLEVWRTNVGAAVTNNRNILALTDLGESNPSNNLISGGISTKPTNSSNNLLSLLNTSAVRSIDNVTSYMQGLGFVGGTDYEKVESARLLPSSEYTFNEQLGFITLSQPLSADQVLAVAYQYQVIGDTTVYQVGELTTDGVNDPNTLVVKLIKGTGTDTRSPLWKLMMKNVYFLRSTQIGRENFRLNVLYESREGGVGIGYFTDGPKEGIPLIELFGLDRMDASQNYYYADGVFDWFDSAAFKGGIIQASTGRIFFPYVEPFGKDLREILNDDEYAKEYCFDSLYTMTRTLAQQYADKNKFYIEGYYSSTVSGEISLGYSVSQGSVTVTAGGMPLIENVDYTVDYTMGTVRIINESLLSSGTPISVSSENNSFSMMTKRMLGTHINYEIQPDFNVGGTFMNLYEKPLTQKNNFGEEPTSNSIWGLDLNYHHEAPFITKLIDKLPGIDTKAPSNLSVSAEFAQFVPGLAYTGTKEGSVTYVDDFEGAESSIDLKGITYWHLASTPQDFSLSLPKFPETQPGTGLAYGFNRAKLAWYRIDNMFYSSQSPDNITDEDRSRPYARRIYENEVFPNKSLVQGEPTMIYELNLAYYPDERGPYNYDVAPSPFSAGLTEEGRLADPRSRWAGIMRKLDYTDFETQNIETLEFWLMDPFIENPNHTGGKLYINLGDISEDILRDGRKSFENGLPTSSEVTGVDTTIWGRVPNTQPIVNAFDNNDSARRYQDVGYDGLSSTHGMTDEQSFFSDYINQIRERFGENSVAYQLALQDPSADDFHYYRGSDYDDQDVKINDRYKYYNNPEGNSAVDADNREGYSTAASTYPNVEDINKDNTLSEAENYYQYVLEIDPAKMVIGENHIVDIQEAENVLLADGSTTSCKWYQFRIPIREYDQQIGKLNGFQSIRFMRMFLNDFEEPIILRFATLDLVYSTWRKYTEELLQPGDYTTGTGANTSFSISTVSIEENGSRYPVPYVLPPEIDREQWYSTSSAYTLLNEQALSLDITDLASGDARAVYRNSQYDLRNYGKLKMFVHAEKKSELDDMDDDDLVLFVRLGSDYTNNYYEYEVPLKFTEWGVGKDDPYVIWPQDNNVVVDLTKLVDIKTNRNRLIRGGDLSYNSQLLYSEFVDGHKYTVLGSPNLGKVKVIMVGVRNPKKERMDDGNNMLPKSCIVWLNELRLTDFNNRGGWAATALARSNLADLGNLSLYGSYRTAGFGNLEEKPTSLELVNTLQAQTTMDLELGKFLPEEWGIHIPFYLDWNKQVGSPEYNPMDPDVRLKDDLLTYQTQAERDSVRAMAQERKTTTNLTLTNVRKDRTGKNALKQHFYDIENLSLSYAYSRERSSDDEISYYNKDQHHGTLTYSFTPQEQGQVTPFSKSKSKFINSKNAKFIKDFNFCYKPKNFSFNTEIYRDYEETMLRNKGTALVIMKPTYFKQFTWKRDYGLQWDFARSIHLQYNASANTRIDEPVGRVDTRECRDSIWKSIAHGGTMQNFQQTVNLTWDVPITKLPYMDFLRMPITYRTVYNYMGTTQALAAQGSTLNSSGQLQASVTGQMQTLYNKFPFIKNAYKLPSNQPPKDPKRMTKKERDQATQDSIARAKNPDSVRRAEAMEMLHAVANWGIRFVTCLKSFGVQYSNSTGSILPGYMGTVTLLGMDARRDWMPGPAFVMGYNDGLVERLRDNNLLSTDTLMNRAHENTLNRMLSLQASVEPIRDFKIELSANQTYQNREEYYYKYLSEWDRVEGPLSYVMSGTYSTTCWSLATSFKSLDDLYNDFLKNRHTVANRLASMNPDSRCDELIRDTMNGEFYPFGYGANQQTVLLTSFLATYMGKDVGNYAFTPFLGLPMPNWSISYNGLNKIKALKKWFNNISISHKYSSTYSIGNYYTDAAISGRDGYDYGMETVLNGSNDFIAPISMEAVQINEQFNPLIRLSVSMTNSVQINFSMQKNRTLAMSFSNNQLTETTRDGITFGGGYRFKDVAFDIQVGDEIKHLKSDVVLQLNLTYNDNKTNIRKINQQNVSQVSSGSEVWMVELSGEYALSSTLTLRAFFQTNINNPYIMNSYPNSTTKGGITIRFNF
ncbi:MAG: cell surface protein SprA [Bacteroidales bacterium]|nr:cell surface protein SprA [Bacteroidales bacterium]